MYELTGHYTLRDDSEVLIRRIEPGDKERLQEGLHHLSTLSRYRRFMAVPSDLSEKELKYLTEVDQVNHLAWIAVDPAQPGEPGLGVARCIRLEEEPTVGEVAVTVLDSHQGQGLGTILLGILGMAAIDQGIGDFRAFVLATNTQVLDLLRQLGAKIGEREGTARWFDVPVPKNMEDLPDSPAARVFMELARTHPPA